MNDRCVCRHQFASHMTGEGPCRDTVVDTNTPGIIHRQKCYCPRFIPAPQPPGSHRGEGKDRNA